MSVTHSSVKISYEPPSYADNSRNIEYMIKYCKEGENDWKTTETNSLLHTITGLDEDSTYNFTVVARYEGESWGNESDHIRLSTTKPVGKCCLCITERLI